MEATIIGIKIWNRQANQISIIRKKEITHNWQSDFCTADFDYSTKIGNQALHIIYILFYMDAKNSDQ